MADQLVALLEEFEAALSEGRIPWTLAERLTDLRHTAEKLIDSRECPPFYPFGTPAA